ncbi:hypothetical protein C1T31_07845 [Hanstruepera neustonica]|uniref:Ig-like domain-containing protein n=1 Tax=Hanstruepera neustonica TaxID=1445657 RepID=A0A2K1DZJ6_9FLAO|nr:T9SS type B sorting domain-containing protein [Hanstruepera neustonica]PNQ73414.1 hypothetical protein C1T31_07845 [Hanstruepera neustonica]
MKKLITLFLIVIAHSIYAQGPGCPNVQAGPNQVIDCDDAACVDLTATYLETGETNSYAVSSIPFNPPSNFNGLANPLFVNIDDIWSGVVNLPFEFCFFNNNYNQLIVGANGGISFDVSNANTFNGWAFSQTIPNNTNATLADVNIFGAVHDIDPAASNGTHEIGWEVKGTAPCRTFVVSYFNVAQFSCNNLKTFQQIVLYEGTNTIEVYILDKPTCLTWNNGNAVIGIQNPAGTIAYTPPGRNTGNWSASIEAWRFTPNGTPNYDITWYDGGGSPIGNSDTVNVCPTADETFTVEVEYTNCDGSTFTDSDTVTVSVSTGGGNADFTMTPTCDGAIATINGDTGGTFTLNPDPGAPVSIDPATGVVTGGTPGVTYTVDYTIGGACPANDTQSFTVLTAADASFTMTATCDGGTATINGDAGGTFTLNPDPGAPVSIDPATGVVTGGTPGVTYTVEYTIAGTCGDSDTQTVTVLPEDDPSFTMTATCDGGTATITGDAGGTFTLNPDPGAPVSIDPATGVVTGGTPGVTYTVEYTTAGVCPDSDTQTVTVLPEDDPSFTMTATCDGGTATITGDAGGTFTLNPDPGAPVSIDPATGVVTGGTPGVTYTVEYTTAGVCPDSDTQTVTVLTEGNADFTMTPTCDGATATINGDTGGTFTLNPDPGAPVSIDPATGVVTGGTPGVTYTVDYTIGGACPANDTQSFTVLTAADASFTMTATCDGGTATINGDAGGTFTLNPDPGAPVSIDPATGVVTGGTPGVTYTVEYTIAGTCGDSDTQTVTVLPEDNPSFTMTATCDGGTATINGDAGGTFTLNPDPGAPVSIDPATGVVTGGTPGVTYTVEYTTAGVCPDSDTQTVTVLPEDDPSFTMTATCDGGIATINGDAGGTFTLNPDPGAPVSIDPATGVVTGGTPGVTYTVEYTTAGVCPDSDTQTVTVLPEDDPSFTMTATCDGGTATINGDAGGTFTLNPDPGAPVSIDPATGVVTGGTPGVTYTVEYTTAGVCPDSDTQTVTVLPEDDPSFTMTATCDGGTATVSGTAGGTFTLNPDPGAPVSIDPATGVVTGGTPGVTYTVEYTTAGVCPDSDTQTVTVLPEDDPSFTMTATCDGGTATINGDTGGTFTLNPDPGAPVSINSTTGEVTGGTGGVTYTIEYTTSGSCPASTTQDVTVLTEANTDFTITATCDGGTATITGDVGGTFTLNPDPGAPVSIDSATGLVTGGTPGVTYTVQYEITGACSGSSTQDVTVLPIPSIVDPTPLVVCDDDVSDGMTELDLTIKNDEIAAGNSDYVVTYYNSLVAAESGSPEVSPSDDAYIGTDGEVVYIRVEDSNTGCFTTTTLVLNVTNGPDVNPLTPLTYCDPDNDNLGDFDLSTTRDEILASDATLDVSFHLTLQNAQDDVNPQGDTLSNVAGQIIYVRVDYGDNDDCPTIVQLQLIVEPTPEIPTSIDPYVICDDDFDGTASFDLTIMDATIYGTQNPADFILTYHETLADAEASPGLNPIMEPQLSDYVSGNTTIYVRLEGLNGCIKVGQFDLMVNPLPVIPAEAQDGIFEVCDDTNDNDGYAIFDLTSQNDAYTGGDVTLSVDYFETMADIPSNPIANYESYQNTSIGGLPHNPQTIFVTVTETTSGGNCSSMTTLTLVVNTLPTPNDVLPDMITCDDNNPGDLQEEFDLTLNEGLMLNDFDETVTYHESMADAESGENPISNETAYTNIATPQTIYVRVTNTGDPNNASDDGTGCYTIITFDLIVNPIPMFTPDDLYTICVNTNGTEVVGSPTIDTGLSATDYTFEWEDPNGVIVSIDSSYTAVQAGAHIVTITNIDTQCFNVISVNVEESSPPIVDATVVTEAFADDNVIQVIASGDGAASYEFSIDNGPWVSNEPNDNTYTFTNVTPGEHFIQVRDIYGCGIGSDTVLVMDYPLFFTPNNDGDNDTWQISGISSQMDAKIYIFDRYGKLLKQLSPSSPGWDGTLNGYPLPSSDYWFTVDYREPSNDAAKQFQAHFTLKR